MRVWIHDNQAQNGQRQTRVHSGWAQAKRCAVHYAVIGVYTALALCFAMSALVMAAQLRPAQSHMPCVASHVPMMTNISADIRC